jgi:hypothetical protein
MQRGLRGFRHGSSYFGFVAYSSTSQEIDRAIVGNSEQPPLQWTTLVELV